MGYSRPVFQFGPNLNMPYNAAWYTVVALPGPKLIRKTYKGIPSSRARESRKAGMAGFPDSADEHVNTHERIPLHTGIAP